MAKNDIEVQLDSGEKLPAYLATPENGEGAAGVVILQEIFGINANIRSIADDYAARGFNAIAPDLFWRQEPGVQLDPATAEGRERATELMKGMDQPLAVKDALAAAEYVRALPGANGKVGAVGYCLGGKLAYMMAMETGIAASASYYGVAIQGALDKAANLKALLLLHIAEDDHLCPPEAQEAIKGALGSMPNVEILSYPGVGHAFARRNSQPFNAEAADRADAATAKLFADNLKG